MASASRELQLLGSRNPATLFFLTGFPFYSRFQNFFSYIYTREVIICYLIVYYLIFVHLLFNVWQKKIPDVLLQRGIVFILYVSLRCRNTVRNLRLKPAACGKARKPRSVPLGASGCCNKRNGSAPCRSHRRQGNRQLRARNKDNLRIS